MLVSNCKLSVHFESAEDGDHGNMKEVAFAAMGNAINGCKDHFTFCIGFGRIV
ncbi:unnamed protein product [Malus baccata var. baccata]